MFGTDNDYSFYFIFIIQLCLRSIFKKEKAEAIIRLIRLNDQKVLKLIASTTSPSSSTNTICNLKSSRETLAMAEPKAQAQDEERYGVLLYYKYIEIPDLDKLVAFYESNCNSLGLLGRVRLSHNGVNVTVGPTTPLFFPFVSRENAKYSIFRSHFSFQNGDVK